MRSGVVWLIAAALSVSGIAPEAAAEQDRAAPSEAPEAFGREGPESVSGYVTTELIAEHVSVQPGGSTRIGVHFDLAKGWHIYAEDPGDAGLPTQVVWSGPPGVVFGPLQWPKPQQFIDPGHIRTFGYIGALVLSSGVTVAPTAIPQDTISIRAKVKWLACKDTCIPGSASLELTLPVSSSPPVFSTHAEFFDHTN